MRIDDQACRTPTAACRCEPIERARDPSRRPAARAASSCASTCAAKRRLFLSEHRVRVADGHWTWVRARGRVVERNANGRALRVAGTARDITATRNAERERRIASEVLRSMAEAVACSIATSTSSRSTRPSPA